ncbi:surface lipoprotein assembly modifier [Aliidiomarina indica]|uniref:surface lipoprotein assembly modifier n=1 Tax=Aliidiomarina indica TaxID=2749147 RepID=UPI00188F941A|nr:surface lipoprotein assembly modifier [Aliidiomarina indica]
MNHIRLKISPIALALACALSAGVSSAQDASDSFSFSARVDVSGEHNSNVSVSELETAIGESDTATLIELALDAQWQPAESWNIDGGYSYSDRRYHEFSEFDLAMHLIYADVSYDFDVYTVGANYYFADANLGGDSFLDLHQRSVYLARMLGDQFYARFALNQSEKTFADFSERDADTLGGAIDLFYFFNEGRSFLLFGANHDDEDARNNEFSYQANTLRVRYSTRFAFASGDGRFQLGYRWHDRDYEGISAAIGQARSDRHQVIDARVEVPVWRQLSLIGQVERGDYSSNLDSADYDETRASIGVRLRF